MRIVRLRTFAIPDALEQIEQVMSALWADHPHVPEAVRVRVGIAVSEVAANIIEHATKGLDRLVHVHVGARVRDRDVMITFVDDGIPTPAASFVKLPDDSAERGRCLPLANKALRELRYQRTQEHNHWTLLSEAF